LLLLVVALAACGGGAAVSADDVESQAQEQFSAQFPVDSVDCPEDLPAEVGAEIVCTLESEGKSFEMTATTTAINGEDVDFDLELTAELGTEAASE
jgi:hypothetical protein